MKILSRANTQEKWILINPEKFKHTELGEINYRKFTKFGVLEFSNFDFTEFCVLEFFWIH